MSRLLNMLHLHSLPTKNAQWAKEVPDTVPDQSCHFEIAPASSDMCRLMSAIINRVVSNAWQALPLCLRFQTYHCVAANRREGPKPDSRIGEFLPAVGVG